MGQLISVRTNQDFQVDYINKGKLVPQTEVIVLVEKPKYVSDKSGQKIIKKSEIVELRFDTGTEGLNHLIGQLQAAQRNAAHYDQMAGALNEIIVNSMPPEGEVVEAKQAMDLKFSSDWNDESKRGDYRHTRKGIYNSEPILLVLFKEEANVWKSGIEYTAANPDKKPYLLDVYLNPTEPLELLVLKDKAMTAALNYFKSL